MLDMGEGDVPIVPSATVVPVRDGPQGLEVLLLQRNRALKHMGGEWVFPGGRIDPSDYPVADDHDQAALQAAIRETREEADVQITPEQLHFLSHWTTPEGARRRYSTWFFLAVLDADAEIRVDGGEISAHRWVRPQDAFAEIRDTQSPFRLMPPTYVSLVDLADFRDCATARAALGARPPRRYAPRMIMQEGGVCFLYEEDAGYADLVEAVSGPRHRTYMINDQLEYIREGVE
ncbi:NUDIX domain-containing protein [Haliea sp.]|jgi:8-oxo-dGTP pyrophosphatase MutT (NUDIX family)|uniref:NUDIX hydrolase n=1 Tax=Haliea sp. TaxID=1932666 RepID=UPI003527E5BD